MKLLLTGANGQVGFELQRALAPLGTVVALDRAGCNLADADSIRAAIDAAVPDVIVNAAAWTAVDKAETEREAAFAINATALQIIGAEAAARGVPVIHYSTDYVFAGDGTRAWREDDAIAPCNAYGASKAAGEQALRDSGARHLILRTSWVYAARGGNFLRSILRLAAQRQALDVVADQWGAPTSAALIADATAQMLAFYCHRGDAAMPWGTLHLAAAGETNWHGFASHIVDAARRAGAPLQLAEGALRPIPGSAWPSPAQRPANSRLDTTRLRDAFGLVLPAWQHGADHVLTQLLTKAP